MSKSISTITRGIAALALSIAGLAVFAGAAGAAALTAPVATAAGSGAVTLTFTAGATDLVYAFTSSPAGGSCVITAATVSASNSCTVTGLTNGTSYTFSGAIYATTTTYAAGTVSATNTIATSNAITPSATPNAPTIGTATDTYGTGAITVNFTAPSSNGIAISGYQVTNSATLSTATVLCTTSNPLATSCTYTPTVAYAGNLYVEALSAGGPSAASGAVAIAAPGAPTGTPATVQSGGNTTVSLAAVTHNPNASLANTKWTVLYGVNTVCTAAASATSCTFSNTAAGLTDGASAVFTIKDFNAAGSTADATPSTSIIIGTQPGAFTATAVVNNAKGIVVVSPAAAAGYTYYDSTGISQLTCALITGTSTCGILIDADPANNGTALAAGKLPSNYLGVILVKATNAASLYKFAATNTVGPLSFPAAPASASMSGTSGTLTTTWASVSTALSYLVQLQTCTTNVATATNTTCVASGSPVVVPAGTTTKTFTEAPGVYYNFTVQAVSAAGASAVAYPAAPLQASTGAPSGVTSKITGSDNSSATVTWTAPTSTGGSAVTGYSLQLYVCTTNACTTKSSSGSAVAVGTSSLTYTFKNIPLGIYTIGVSSVNGLAVAGEVFPSNTYASVNQAPNTPSVTYTATTVDFAWAANGSTTNPYTVASYSLINSYTGAVICTTTSLSCSVAASLVTSGQLVYLYTTDASGVISNGRGSVTPAKPSTTPTTAFAASTAYTNSAGDISVSWTDADTNVVSYTLVALGIDGTTISKTVPYVSGQTTYVYVFPAASLTAASYTFQVSASNSLGSSTYSTALFKSDSSTATGAAANYTLTVATAAPTPIGIALGNTVTTPGVLSFAIVGGASSTGNATTSYTGTLVSPTGQTQTCTTATASGTLVPAMFGLGSGTVYVCTFSGVTTGSKYTFTAVANAPLLSSLASTAVTALAVGQPAAPVVTSVTNAKNTVSNTVANGTAALVTWTQGDTGGIGLPTVATAVTIAGTAIGTTPYLNNVLTLGAAASATNGIYVGELVTGTGIPAGTTVAAIGSAYTSSITGGAFAAGQIALSGFVTGTAVLLGDTITFSPYVVSATNAAGTVVGYCSPTTINSTYCTITGLSINTAYTFSVVTVNANGSSKAGKLAFTTAGAPSAPTDVKATLYGSSLVNGGAGSVALSWTAPTNTGGINTAISNYVVTGTAIDAIYGTKTVLTVGSGITCADAGVPANGATLKSTSAICYLTGVTLLDTGDGSSITFSVQAVSSTGVSSAASTSSNSVSPVDAPATLTLKNVATASNGFVLSWDDSKAANGAVNSYNVKVVGAANGTYTTTTSASSLTLPYGSNGIFKGGSYVFQVQAVTATGVTSAWATSVAGSVPSAATAVKVFANTTAGTAATKGFIVTWTASSSETSASDYYYPVTYNVQATLGGTTVVNTTTTSTSFSYAVAGLTSAASAGYAWSVTASNIVGSAAAASEAARYTNASTPGAASSASASAAPYAIGLSDVTISFTGPTGINSDTPGIYAKVSYTVSIVSLTTGKSTSCAYTSGSTSASTAAMVYDCVVPNGDSYAYSITTANAQGASVATAASGYIATASDVATAPQNVAVAMSVAVTAAGASNNSATVTWSAPASNGGSSITGYVVVANTAADQTTPALALAAAGAVSCATVLTSASTTCTLNGLAAATPYYFNVFALNANGSSDQGYVADYLGAAKTVTTLAAASTPASVTAITNTYGDVGSLTVSWTPAVTTSTLVVTYTVKATGSIAGDIITCTTTQSSCTLAGLSNTQTYTIAVNSANAYSVANATTRSDAGTTTSKWTKPSYAPVIAAAISKVSGTVTVVFAGPFQAAGGADASSLTGYTVTATDSTGKVVGTVGAATDYTAVAGAKQVTITGLTSGATYTVSVIANNAVGASPAATASVVSLAQANPSAVTGLTASRNATGLAVKWTAPASLGSAAQLVGYWVTATDPLSGQQYTCPYNTTYGVVMAPAVTCSILGLTVGTVYNVSVTAIAVDGAMNKLLSSAATATATYTTLAPEPVMATFLAVTAKQKSVSALSGAAKTALASLISSTNDGAQITITGYGTTKAIALARANAAASYLFNNGAAVHVTIASVISKTVKTALVTVTSN